MPTQHPDPLLSSFRGNVTTKTAQGGPHTDEVSFGWMTELGSERGVCRSVWIVGVELNSSTGVGGENPLVFDLAETYRYPLCKEETDAD